MAKQALTVKIRIDGARETVAAFRRLPKEASQELRERSLQLAAFLAGRARSAGIVDSAQSALVATTVKPVKDRVPAITVGGSRRVGRNRAPAYKILFGAEFGSNRLRQFRPHRGRKGYWFFSTVEREQGEISKAWNDIADTIVDKFTRDGV